MAKILVSVDDRLLARIDRAAGMLGLSRSAYLSRLASRAARASYGPGRTAGARRAARKIDELFASSGHGDGITQIVRRERDSH